jgi:hypothetical protein
MPTMSRAPRRRPIAADGCRHALSALLFAGWLILAVPVSTFAGSDEPAAPLLYDGDLLSTCDTRGPGLQRLSLRCGLATGESETWGTLQTTALRAEYGLRDDLSAGLAATFYSESHARLDGTPALTKQGPGDMRLFLRWQYTGLESSSFSLGLRPALRIPTGYDRDADSLAPFTTRTLDFELLGLATLETDRVDFYLNPGISLPGEDHNSELLAGLGMRAHDGLPFGLQLTGEYFTRYDLPARTFRHEVYAALGVPLPLGLLADVGVRKPLLDTEQTQPEIAVRLGLGLRHRAPDLAAHERTPACRVALAPCASAIEDPHGLARAIDRELHARLVARRDLEVTGSPSPDDPRVRLEILALQEGTERGLSVPKLFASPRATLALDARLTLTDAGGRVIYGERLLHVSVGRGTGMLLVPNEGDEDTWVPTGEVRERLRIAAARSLAEQAHAAITQMIVEMPGR